jgi:hypothetical protein
LKTEASEAFDVLDTFLKITRQANPIISQIQFHSSLICVRHTKFVVQLSLLLVSSLRTNCQEW